jgi:nitrogen fixation/metabolism regulation signal transduction histidine kinase
VSQWSASRKIAVCAALILTPAVLVAAAAIGAVFSILPSFISIILLVAGLVGMIAGMYAARQVAREIIDPLRRLASESALIAQGHQETLAIEDRRDEIGEIATAFRRVVETSQCDRERLLYNNEELQAMNQQLEAANE